ncbi:helix-turn-helix transcriptional regulator [Gluconacetobacter sacchari]|uniref:Helix-turn-helix domain-containing protein n=1 Tax=Gluconacetobacter sacchari TaxID=92759 RepID=A0A7W4IH23_9PROT|nr:helix-turn-helix domain-containing protein [Gluconacetobacter sacchari]MBB2162721.1 helix-turn-helix domain-containing protein [Gluconacetobacter sacchari]
MTETPRLMRVREAARFLGIAVRTLEKHRTYGTGPLYRKVGGRVLYAVEDMMAWTAEGARRSPSDKTSSRVFPARPLTPAERESL